MSLAEVVGIASLIVAVLSAVGGLIYKQLDRRDKRPYLEVETALGKLTFTSDELMMFFNVINVGQAPVTISAIYLDLPDDQRLLFPYLRGERALPCRLEPGEKCHFWHGYRQARDSLRGEGYSGSLPVTVVIEDALGNRYTKETNFRVSQEGRSA